jgi:hypothetical protein
MGAGAMTELPSLPPGFVLDNSSAGSAPAAAKPQAPAGMPALPPGFELDFNQRFSGDGNAVPKNAEALSAGLRDAADQKLDMGPGSTFLNEFGNTALLNVPRNFSAFLLSRDAGIPFSNAYDFVKDVQDASSRRNRKASIGGTVAGALAGAAVLPGIGGGATLTARAGQAAVTGAGYAGLAEAFDSKDPVHVAIAAGLGGALGGLAAPVAEKIVGLVSGLVKKGATSQTFLKPDGTLTDEAAAIAREAGIDPGTFGTVMQRKFAETLAEKGASPGVAREAAAGEFNIPLSQGQAAQDLDKIRFENMSARGAYGKPAQDVANEFQANQNAAMRQAGSDVGEQLARDRVIVETPGTAGRTINAEVGAQAQRGRNIVSTAGDIAEREAAAQRGIVADQGRAIDDIASNGRLPLSRPQDAGEVVGDAVRNEASRARGGYRAAYDDALSREGEFSDIAFHGIGERIRRDALKGDNPVVINDRTTPVAASAIRHLDENINRFRVQDRAEPRSMEARTAGEVQFPGEPMRVPGATAEQPRAIALNMRGVEQSRKELVSFYKAARASGNAEDIRAVRSIISGFDNELETAISTGLFKGDEAALPALREARALFSRYQNTFRPQGAGDDVGSAMRRIVERNATPEEIANMLYGSSRTGSTGLSVRLADRLEQTLGRDSEAWSAVRQAAWMRVSQMRNGAGEVDPAKSASAIMDFTSGSGRSLAERLFSREELGAMRDHAQGVRGLEAAIADSSAARNAEAARTGYQQIFGGENIGGPPAQVLRRIIDGQATPEETAGAVFNAISGNPGNASRVIAAIERITGKDSDSMAAIRQGVWQRLTEAPEGKDQPGAQRMAQNLAEFLSGKGRTIAEQLFTAEERSLMGRYASAVKMTVVPPNARTNSDTAPALLAALNKYGGTILSLLGVAADGATGGLAGYAVNSLLKKGFGSAAESRAGARAANSFNGGVPAQAAPPSDLAKAAGRAAGVRSGLIGDDLEDQLPYRRP